MSGENYATLLSTGTPDEEAPRWPATWRHFRFTLRTDRPFQVRGLPPTSHNRVADVLGDGHIGVAGSAA
jgi:hypothetical protein